VPGRPCPTNGPCEGMRCQPDTAFCANGALAAFVASAATAATFPVQTAPRIHASALDSAAH